MGLFEAIKNLFVFSYNVMEGAPSLTAAHDRGLAMGAVYAVEGDLPINALTMEADQRSAATVLRGAWNTVDGASARDTYRYLLNGGHAKTFQVMHPYLAPYYEALMADRRSEARAAYERGHRELPALASYYSLDPSQVLKCFDNWQFLYMFGEELPDRLPQSIVAWDAARVVHVSRLFVDAGFIEPAEAWSAIDCAVDMARPAFSSWSEFNEAFLVGRVFWQLGLDGFDAEKVGEDAGTFARAARHLLTRDDSPWKRLTW